MPHRKPFAPLLVLALLVGCGRSSAPVPEATATPTQSETGASAIEPTASFSKASGPVAAGLGLPDTFTALGTEPFWAAKVAGDRLTYMTPEDQAGQTIAVDREDGAELVELSGTLAGKPLALTIGKGPCSDGMSDVVYRWSVERRLGDDVQRGCARLPGDATEGGRKP